MGIDVRKVLFGIGKDMREKRAGERGGGLGEGREVGSK